MPMSLELDHIYMLVHEPYQPAKVLKRAGFHVWDKRAQHAGAGTEATMVVFSGSYLELLFESPNVHADALSEIGKQSRSERINWRQTGRSPFGIGCRRSFPDADLIMDPARKMHWPWMPGDEVIEYFGAESETFAPEVFVIPPAIRMASPEMLADLAEKESPYGADIRSSLSQRAGIHPIKGVHVTVTSERGLTPAMRMLNAQGIVTYEVGSAPLLNLRVASLALPLDLRPHMPIVLEDAGPVTRMR